MDLILIRHGKPVRDITTDGSPADPCLSEIGHRQAEITADFLVPEGIDHVVSSTMARARQTAEPLAAKLGLEIEQLDDLQEADNHMSEYIPQDEWVPGDATWKLYEEDPMFIFEPHGGFEAFRAKVTNALEKLIADHRGRTVAVFAHGLVMGSYLTGPIGHTDPYMFSPAYCGLVRIKASSNGLRSVVSVNEHTHVRDLL